MIGNVWEWVADRYDENAYHTLPPIDPVNRNGKLRVLRGGSWINDYSKYLRVAYRDGDNPDDCGNVVGFRVGASAPQDSR